MPAALEAFLVAFGVVFLAELPDKTMFATIVLSTRYRRPVAVVVGVTLAMIFHSVLAVAVGEALRHLPHRPLQIAVAVLFLGGGIVLLRGSRSDSDEEIETAPVHSAWGVIGRTALVIGIAEFGDFTQLATVGIVANRGYAAAVAAGSVAAHIVVAILAVLAGKWLERRLPVRTIQRLAGVLFIVFGVVTVTSAIRG
ncbi:MAG TPA: TMEM165/GDT1 family protein [Ilumatobacteraceae bacterium]|nr:TMEM165/GDT1 family protein [Ilumatobacteraceae bacterium]